MSQSSDNVLKNAQSREAGRVWKRLTLFSLLLNALLFALLLLNSWSGKEAFIQDLDHRLTNWIAG